ncbi:endonuclease MutS2 [Abyssisolibacter fermentans]|uniref:endonuclease MutS2 n=1 Tax=Abyssisolibacter fermentans TaxID=1766203 RepID=UPI000830F0E4|nr:mannonate oxidoreductase [Abyssisolibacter fermentans]
MNTNTFEKLEYNELLERLKEYCVSGLGKTLVDKLKPFTSLEAVKKRLRETTEAKKILFSVNHVPFDGINDINAVISKLSKFELLTSQELMMISDFLRGCRRLKKFMSDQEFYAPILSEYSWSLTEYRDIEDEINSMIKNSKIASDATKELSRIRRKIDILEDKIKRKLDDFITSSKNKSYMQEFFVSKRGDKYVVPIIASYKNKVEGNIIDYSTKGTTVYIEPKIIAKLNHELADLRLSEQQEEYQILAYLTGLVQENAKGICINAELIAQYDLIFAKAKYSEKINGIEPKINANGYINIIEGEHFLLGEKCVPLNIHVGKNYRTLVITGPNAGGKTVALKTVGILTLAVQMGLHVKAQKGTELSIFKNIFVDIGDNQSIKNALSTFSSHMKNIADIINKADKNTLILFDELGVGTEPNEGANLAIAILEELYYMGCITVVTTHYADIKEYATKHFDFENAHMKFDTETLQPLYELIIGKGGESNALWISRKMGLKETVIKRAQKYISTKEYNFKPIKQNKLIVDENLQEDSKEEIELRIGDRVKILGTDERAIVFKEVDKYNNIEIMVGSEFREINIKRVTLEVKRENLYPEGYDLNSLFVKYKDRKLEKDIKRGSKKALKNIQKELKKKKITT